MKRENNKVTPSWKFSTQEGLALVAALSARWWIRWITRKQSNKPAYQLPSTALFLLQSLLLVTFSLLCVVVFFFFGVVIGCGKQVTNCHCFIQSSFTLHSLHFELSRIRLSLESFFFHSFIGYSSCNIQYKFRSKSPKGVGATGLTSHARQRP